MIEFSIIAPVYQAERYLERFIYSVLAQNYENYELILVDDGSCDGSGRICDEFSNKHHQIRTIHKENGGVSSARNVGIKNAKGQYIIFGDADDYYDSTFLDDIAGALKKNPQDICICGYYYESNRGSKQIIPQLSGAYCRESLSNISERVFKDNCFNSVWNKVFRLDIINQNQIDFPIQKIAEDGIFVCRYLQKVESLYFMDKAYYHYCQNEGSAVHKFCTTRWQDENRFLEELRKCTEDLAPEKISNIMGVRYRNAILYDLYNLLEAPESALKCARILKKHLKEVYDLVDWNCETKDNMMWVQITFLRQYRTLEIIVLMRVKRLIMKFRK